jgi:7-cyano-7-deazaguanine synthase
MKKAVILFSGGLDSTTVLAYAKNNNFECYPITFNYG